MRIGLLVLVLMMSSSLVFLPQGSAGGENEETANVDFEGSNQVLHRRSENKSYLLSPEATNFVEKTFKRAIPVKSDSEVLRIGSDYVSTDGEYLVFGVGCGKAVNFLAALNPTHNIICFDSFTTKKPSTPFLHNVRLIEGQFRDTLPSYSTDYFDGLQIAFIYINCHTYQSTKDVFLWLKDYLGDRTVIVFDEFYNFPGFENEELKAFEEFLVENRFQAEYLSYNTENEQVAVRLKKRW
jgi:hypothetical protein